jgi:hypothetical protein
MEPDDPLDPMDDPLDPVGEPLEPDPMGEPEPDVPPLDDCPPAGSEMSRPAIPRPAIIPLLTFIVFPSRLFP